MSTQVRFYDHARDYAEVGRFLIDTYVPGDTFGNWLQPRWEYAPPPVHPQRGPVDVRGRRRGRADGRIGAPRALPGLHRGFGHEGVPSADGAADRAFMQSAEGAAIAWVGSSQPFYKAIGFTTMFTSKLWVKLL